MHKRPEDPLEMDTILELVNSQEKPVQHLFAKALNIYFSPGSADEDSREKLDQLRKALEQG